MSPPDMTRRQFGKTAMAAAFLAWNSLQAEVFVQTMTGPVPVGRLGTTLMHEHVLYGVIPDQLRDVSVQLAVELLREAGAAGIRTIVDLTPTRDIALYQQIARQVPVQIIASTGSYVFERTPAYLQQMNEEQMYERIVREVTEGIDGTKVRAGIIKVAGVRPELTPWEQTAFRAAARAQRHMGTPIGTHAIFGAREQFDLLTRSGADPSRCFFSHIEASFAKKHQTREQLSEYLIAIAREGGSLLFNNFGFEFDTPWEDLVFLMRSLCEKGYSHKVFASVDCNWEWTEGRQVFEQEANHPATARRSYAYMMLEAVPELRQAGFSAADIHTFLVENPARFFRNAAPGEIV